MRTIEPALPYFEIPFDSMPISSEKTRNTTLNWFSFPWTAIFQNWLNFIFKIQKIIQQKAWQEITTRLPNGRHYKQPLIKVESFFFCFFYFSHRLNFSFRPLFLGGRDDYFFFLIFIFFNVGAHQSPSSLSFSLSSFLSFLFCFIIIFSFNIPSHSLPGFTEFFFLHDLQFCLKVKLFPLLLPFKANRLFFNEKYTKNEICWKESINFENK